MCRLRISERDHEALAATPAWPILAEQLCGPFCTSPRAEFAGAQIPFKNSVALRSKAFRTSALASRGSGADNIRNVTARRRRGSIRQELIDTREYAREWHYHILNRSLR